MIYFKNERQIFFLCTTQFFMRDKKRLNKSGHRLFEHPVHETYVYYGSTLKEADKTKKKRNKNLYDKLKIYSFY